MLDNGVFEPVSQKSEAFEDQGAKLYRFLPDADEENNDACLLCDEETAQKAR